MGNDGLEPTVSQKDPLLKKLLVNSTPLTDRDIKIFWKENRVPFEKVGSIRRPLPEGVVRIQAVIGGGKTNTSLPFRRNCFSTGLGVCFATHVLDYVAARMAAGILEDPDLPFFRVGDTQRD